MKPYALFAGGLALAAAGCTQEKAPNIVVILADDMGFSDVGCYGGEVETPNLDRLAENGVRYRQFYNCARSCPSRAALLTGLYPHQAGMGWMAAADLQTPPYQGYLNENCVTIAQVLKTAGYGTYMCGKWHVSSDRQNKGNIQYNWPNQRGFDEFYGIVGGAANYFKTIVNINNDRVPTPDDENFYFTHAISDNATNYIANHSFDEEPMFLYVAYNAPHWPLHALQQDIDKYVERYKAGWDVLREERFARQKQLGLFAEDVELSPRDEHIEAWDQLTPEQQEEYVMRMAIYAAQIDALDQGVGRIVAELERRGELDNTIIMFMSDNGACAEYISSGKRTDVDGKSDTYESYRRNWANLSSTPYREYKHYTNEGGIASPLIVHYPNGIDSKLNGTFVDEYGHFTDIMATCVDLAGATYPETWNGKPITPMQGASLVPNFHGGRTDRTVTFWEHEANIAMRDGKWKMVIRTHEGEKYNPELVELYDMEKDPTEMHNLASVETERATSMFNQWHKWAESIGAFPLDTRVYGIRQQAYQRENINGEFVDNFGDWRLVKGNDKASVEFTIDTENVISGDKTARIDIKAQGEKPATAAMIWPFITAKENRKVAVSFDGRSADKTTLHLRMEMQNGEGRIFDKVIKLTPELSHIELDNMEIKPGKNYRLMFLFGKSEVGTCWIDNVKLKVE